MAATGIKLPSLANHSQLLTNNPGQPSTTHNHRRASITDPSLHAHSTTTTTTTTTSQQQQQQQQQQHQQQQQQRTLQLPSKQQHPAAAPRRGSAADLDNILLNSNSPDHRYHPHQQHHQHPLITPDHPSPAGAQPHEFTRAPTHIQQQPSSTNSPISPRSFPTNHQADLNTLSIGPVTSRRPSSAMRRRGSRVNELDSTQTEDPNKLRSSQGTGPNSAGPGYPSPAAGSQLWPYPTPHHRQHLHHHQRPPSPMKRRHSSQSISEYTLPPPPVYHTLPAEQNGPADQPWNSSALPSNHSPSEPFLGEYTIPASAAAHPLDLRRQSATSTVSSSTGTWFDRRQSAESGGCEPADDNQNLVAAHSLRHRSCSSSSNPPFSPTQTALAASIGNYAFPPLPPPGEAPENRPSYQPGLGITADHRAWNPTKANNTFDQSVSGPRGSGLEEVGELKDRLAGTRLDRLPLHAHPVREETDPPAAHQQQQQQQQDTDYFSQGGRLGPAGALSPYSRSPELKISHKLAERKRRKEMRDLFDELRDVLPVSDERHSKGSKWETLSRAVDYMQQVRRENERLRADNLRLQGTLDSLHAAHADRDPSLPHPRRGAFG